MTPLPSFIRARRRIFAFLCVFPLLHSLILAAEPATRNFDLPAGDAAVSLKLFAEQSGQEIIYAVDAVKGTPTSTVKGNYLAKDALDQMLAGTDLVVAQSKGGLLVVKKSPDPKHQRAAQTVTQRDRPNKYEVTELAKLIVTGSNIPTSANATSSPVTILGNKQFDQAGVNANMLELLRKRLPSITGRSNIGASNANNVNQITLGGSQIALRNLDTLVLINGRRVATNGANGIRGRNFVDVNQIPVAAVERVEILTDGASAIYGSDAVGGVVNFILKSDYQGAEVGGRMAWATGAGSYTERSAYAVAGVSHQGVSVTVSGNWTKNSPLFQKDRPFSHTITGRNATIAGAISSRTAFPTHFLNPALNSPSARNPTVTSGTAATLNPLAANATYVPADFATIAATFDSALYTTLLLGQEQKTPLVNASADLFVKNLVAFGAAILGRTESRYQLPAQTTTFTEPAGAPFNPLTIAFPRIGFSYLPAPLQYTEKSKSTWASGGLRGELGAKWSWEAAYTYNDNRITQYQKNVYYTPNLVRALTGGFNAAGNAVAGGAYSLVMSGYSEVTGTFVFQPALDPFARAAGINPASLNNLLGTAVIAVGSKLASADLKLVGTPL